jgi:hypothetical protein
MICKEEVLAYFKVIIWGNKKPQELQSGQLVSRLRVNLKTFLM